MGKVEKKSLAFFSNHGLPIKPRTLIQTEKQHNENLNDAKNL